MPSISVRRGEALMPYAVRSSVAFVWFDPYATGIISSRKEACMRCIPSPLCADDSSLMKECGRSGECGFWVLRLTIDFSARLDFMCH